MSVYHLARISSINSQYKQQKNFGETNDRNMPEMAQDVALFEGQR